MTKLRIRVTNRTQLRIGCTKVIAYWLLLLKVQLTRVALTRNQVDMKGIDCFVSCMVICSIVKCMYHTDHHQGRKANWTEVVTDRHHDECKMPSGKSSKTGVNVKLTQLSLLQPTLIPLRCWTSLKTRLNFYLYSLSLLFDDRISTNKFYKTEKTV